RPRKVWYSKALTLSYFASMEPRSLDRGKDVLLRSKSCMSGGFNGAAVSRPRKDFMAREKVVRNAGFNGAAASRPRKAIVGGVAGAVASASMEPRSLDRGKRKACTSPDSI